MNAFDLGSINNDRFLPPPDISSDPFTPSALVIFGLDEYGPCVKDYQVTPSFVNDAPYSIEHFFIKIAINCISTFGFGDLYEETVLELPGFGMDDYHVVLVSTYNGACRSRNETNHLDYIQVLFFFKSSSLTWNYSLHSLRDPMITILRSFEDCWYNVSILELRSIYQSLLDIFSTLIQSLNSHDNNNIG